MNPTLVSNNLAIYSLQIGLLVMVASLLPAALRLRLPSARLVYCQVVLAACLALPLLRPWTREPAAPAVRVTSQAIVAVQAPGPPAPRSLPWREIALGVIAAGMLARGAWLAAGFWRLSRYRLRSRPFEGGQPASMRAALLLSDEIASPVTFGYRRPVVLLPSSFPALGPRVREAILCHELLHVKRGDWLFTIAEEVVRVVLWFHPAIWWLLGEIQLTREQAVDREVVRTMESSDEYLDALLAIAGARPQLDLAPAPLFLRRRHLKERIVSILKEVHMSKTRVISALAAGFGLLAVACWLITGALQLRAAPQASTDAPGVTVTGDSVIHRAPVAYPGAARDKGIQGTVVVETTIDSSGSVSDARVLSGPVELRRAALESVLRWHFTQDAANSTRQVSIQFQPPPEGANQTFETAVPPPGGGMFFSTTGANLPGGNEPRRVMIMRQEFAAGGPPPPPGADVAYTAAGVVTGGTAGVFAGQMPPLPPKLDLAGRRVQRISTVGLSSQAASALIARLPLKEGDTLDSSSMQKVMQAVREFDEHLAVGFQIDASSNEVTLQIMPPDSPTFIHGAVPATTIGYQKMKLMAEAGTRGSMQVLSKVPPVYPAEAKQAGVEGAVRLNTTVGKDGRVSHVEVISGNPLLVPGALDAVKQWVYAPVLLNGEPVEVITQVELNFALKK